MAQTLQADQVPTTMQARVIAIAEALLPQSKISNAFQPVIRSQLRAFLSKVTEDELRKGLLEVRDKIIPFILNEDTHTE